MKTKLLVFVRFISPEESYTEKIGALVRFYDPHNNDPHLDFVTDFEEEVIWNEKLVPGKVYELIESNGVYGLCEPMGKMSSRQKKWCNQFTDCKHDRVAQINMCTIINSAENPNRVEFALHTIGATRIPISELHNRLGPVPKLTGDYALIRTFNNKGEAFSRFVKPITLKKKGRVTTNLPEAQIIPAS